MKSLKYFLLLMLTLAACSQPSQPSQPLPPVTITVDTSVTPSAPSLPGFEDGEPRPLAGVTGEDGVVATFVANEVWLSTDDDAEVQALVRRWNGKILKTLDPASAGVTGLPKQYLIRIDATTADASKLSEDLRTLEQNSTGDHKVSSQAGLNLIAATSREAVGGLKIGMNWVGSGFGPFTDQTSVEAPTGETLASVAYTPNAFSWPSHDRFSEQDIGVAQAWRAMDLAGKLNNKIKLAVLDMGFQPDNDWPSGYQAINNVPGLNPIGTANFIPCSGGNDCPWHGTNVVSAAMAVPDNNYGSAGPAGPVADPIIVFTTGDFFLSISALLEARVFGARIANMSYGIGVPYYAAFSVLPFEAATASLRATGMLIFASAGNAGQDVDSEGCTFGVCWERTWHTPCENAGVICVGGLKGNSKRKHDNSNYGDKQVDIYAPFTLWLGPDPSAPENKVRAINGTSFSSPFTAGVAALIWAANPDLGAGEVEDILLETAHDSPDNSVNRYVNALAGVQRALGNVPPSITVTNASGEVPVSRELTLSADVFDFEDAFPCCTVSWTSDVDGPLGSGRVITRTFTTLGSRRITVTAMDSAGASSSASLTLNAVNFAPALTLSSPSAGTNVFRTASIVLRGRATDRNEANEQLPCTNLTWTSSVAGDPFPKTGCNVEAVFSSNGPRTLTLTARDAQGATDTESVSITVVDPPSNLPPNVLVTSPEDRSMPSTSDPLTLSGTATDPEGSSPLTYQWTAQLFDNAPVVVGNSASVQWKPSDTFSFNSEGTYFVKVRLNVTDPQGNVGTDFITLEFAIVF